MISITRKLDLVFRNDMHFPVRIHRLSTTLRETRTGKCENLAEYFWANFKKLVRSSSDDNFQYLQWKCKTEKRHGV